MKKYIFFSGFILLSVLFTASLEADDSQTSPWVSNPVVIEEIDEEPDPATTFYGGNVDCIDRKVVTKKELKILGVAVPFFDEQSHNACSIKTKYGFQSNTGYLIRNGTSLAGQIHFKQSGGAVKNLTAIPNSDKVLMKTQQGIRVFSNFDKLLASEYKNGSVKHYLDMSLAGTEYVTDSQGNKISIDIYTIGFSANGRWLVSESSAGGIIRYDLETKESVVFDKNFDHNNGLDPQAQYTISGDGRYVVVVSERQQRFSLFDLENCGPPLPRKTYQNCDQVNLLGLFRAKYYDFLGGSHIRFFDDHNLHLNIGYKKQDGEKIKAKARLYPDGLKADKTAGYGYMGLGDSFASGEGAYDYRPGTDQKDPFNKCHVSQLSYPFLIGQELNLNQYESIACSGAVMDDLGLYNEDEDEIKIQKDSQAEGYESNDFDSFVLDSFLPGYRAQLKFVQFYRPEVVTVSISGNDIGFGDIIKKCVVFEQNCYGNYEDRYNKIQEINSVYQKLVETYSAVRELSADKAKIYAIGYPSLVQEGGYCELNVRLSQDEIKFANQLVRYLNLVIEKAAVNAGISYIDVENALEEYKLCSPVFSHQIAVNGLTVGDDTWFDVGPLGKESYHPNAIGHELLKKTIIRETNGFEKTTGGSTAEEPQPSDSNFLLENVPYDGGKIYSAFGTISVKETILDFHTEVTSEGYAPGSSVYLELHSDPVSFGEFTADEYGTIGAEVELPKDVPAGFHTLYAYGKNALGEDVRSEAIVYVASSENDLDGDGNPNENDSCLVFEPSGVDKDGDGIDDSCDGSVGQLPVAEIIDEDQTRGLPGFDSQPDDTDIIEEVDQTNTQTQSGQNGQNLQPGGTQAQATASGFQTGSEVDTSTDNAAAALNQGFSSGNLSVGVASANSKTSVAPVSTPEVTSSTIPASYVFVPLILLIIFALILAYRRAKKFDEKAFDSRPEEIELLAEASQIAKAKKKRKKPKKPHHH